MKEKTFTYVRSFMWRQHDPKRILNGNYKNNLKNRKESKTEINNFSFTIALVELKCLDMNSQRRVDHRR